MASKSNSFLKYSGIAFQLAAIILLGIFIGGKIDAWLGFDKPYITALLIMILFSGYLYKLNIDLNADRKK